MTFKPLLAAKADIEKLQFPLIASPKIDGIRCLIHPSHGAVSRTLKPIPNEHIRARLQAVAAGLDGELITYTDGTRDDFNTAQSKIMRRDGAPDFRFHVFDDFTTPDVPYRDRLRTLDGHHAADLVEIVPTTVLRTLVELTEIEARFIDRDGWEGVMLRDPSGRYKFGRSTAREAILLKVKRFDDDEAIIVGSVERTHNTNKAFKDALGHTQRSTAKDGLVGLDSLGALKLRWGDIEFEVGTGLDDAQRASLWRDRDDLIGRKVTFKYQGIGPNGRPRFPVFLGIRHDI